MQGVRGGQRPVFDPPGRPPGPGNTVSILGGLDSLAVGNLADIVTQVDVRGASTVPEPGFVGDRG